MIAFIPAFQPLVKLHQFISYTSQFLPNSPSSPWPHPPWPPKFPSPIPKPSSYISPPPPWAPPPPSPFPSPFPSPPKFPFPFPLTLYFSLKECDKYFQFIFIFIWGWLHIGSGGLGGWCGRGSGSAVGNWGLILLGWIWWGSWIVRRGSILVRWFVAWGDCLLRFMSCFFVRVI